MAISPELLVSQVRGTAPYVFDEPPSAPAIAASTPVRLLRDHDRAPPAVPTPFEYYRLCLCAHYVTCATPVPTDVDIAIRQKLWPASLALETTLAQARLVLESRAWDFVPLTMRASYGARGSAFEHAVLHGHYGEWFTVAVGAYAALGRHRAPEAVALRAELLEAVDDESRRHADVFGSVWRAKDGLGALRASVSIAHNFGDLDRVVDMWDLPVTDPLRQRCYKLTASPFDSERRLRHEGRLWTAGELYKSSIDGSSMAHENHRHFALRKPRALRTDPALRVPAGPFFDDFGGAVARLLDGEALDEVLAALVHGTTRLPGRLGYPRALHAIAAERPQACARLASLRADARLRKRLDTPRETFERTWEEGALRQLDDIPSRA